MKLSKLIELVIWYIKSFLHFSNVHNATLITLSSSIILTLFFSLDKNKKMILQQKTNINAVVFDAYICLQSSERYKQVNNWISFAWCYKEKINLQGLFMNKMMMEENNDVIEIDSETQINMLKWFSSNCCRWTII